MAKISLSKLRHSYMDNPKEPGDYALKEIVESSPKVMTPAKLDVPVEVDKVPPLLVIASVVE